MKSSLCSDAYGPERIGMKKWLVAIAYVSLLGFAFIYRYDLLAWAKQHGSFPVLLLLSFLFALVPFMPYKLIIASIAYAVGVWQGVLISWLGTTLAAIAVYWAVRTLFREKGHLYLERVPVLERMNKLMEQEPFMAVLLARLIPFIPQAAVNVYAGVASFPFWSYAVASGIGKLPGIVVYAYAGSTLKDHPLKGILLLLIYTAIIGAAFLGYRSSLSRRKKI